ncbi:MAG TPA: FtsQ-type POTRA domain-containing protein [Edaphobacter sp.]|nr:FtsQ-type POTRA domain-containing protein [Edaphobacter sp.]
MSVLGTPMQDYASEPVTPRRGAVTPRRMLRRDLSDDFADDFEDDDVPASRRQTGTRIRFRGLPATKGGRIAVVVAVLFLLAFCAGAVWLARDLLMHDDRFVIQSSSSIEIEGNSHLTRAQLLSIFGGDVERNIFTVSLADRRAELERLPWVEHATVMRLLPNRMRVSITERTPVAFVRQGNHIGLVDANGVLLDMPTDVPANTHYSFPVVTGIGGDEPLSTRAARMKIFARFTSELDAEGEKISQNLSEVDLSNPEDVKALIPDHASDVLVHFGEENFLDRYKKYEAHLAEWRGQYPKLSAVDMRYERQVVLETGPVPAAGSSPAAMNFTEPSADVPFAAPAVKPPMAKAAGKASPKAKVVVHGSHPAAAKKGAATKASAKRSDVATWVHPKSGTTHAATPSATTQQFHPPQVVKP